MLRIIVLLKVFLVLFNVIYCQATTKDEVINSGEYYFGEGQGYTSKEAYDKALAQINNGIAINISEEFRSKIDESEEELTESVSKVIETYSMSTLKNVGQIPEMIEDRFNVFAYIKKSEVQKIFEERKELIFNLFKYAREYEDSSYYGYALKYYYYAIILMNSIPEQNISFSGVNLITEAPKRINDIIANTAFTVVKDKMLSEKERHIHITAEVFGKKALQLDYSFFDGVKQRSGSIKDGAGVIKLHGVNLDIEEKKLLIQYRYYESRLENATVKSLWDYVIKPSFKNSALLNFESSGGEIEEVEEHSVLYKKGVFSVALKNSQSECPVREYIGKEVYRALKLMDEYDLSGIRNQYSSDPFLREKIISLCGNNGIRLLDTELTGSINKTYEGWEFRKVPVSCVYPSINRQATEYLVFDFNTAGELRDINFGVYEGVYDKFVLQGDHSEDWDYLQIIIRFMERYRTAFMTRNVPMLDKMFADEALIIVAGCSGPRIKKLR